MPIISERFTSSLGIRTELFLDRSRSIVEECDEFAIVRTPQNPGYYLGNYLLFERPPRESDLQAWPLAFAAAFEHDARIKHAAFQWNARGGCGAADRFVAEGYTLEERAILTASSVKRCDVPAGLHLREFAVQSDWRQQFDMQMSGMPPVHDREEYSVFKSRQIEHQRKITEDSGAWLGMFDGERLVGSCGIFPGGEGLARYQDVHVDVPYRNRGVARALISGAAELAFRRFAAAQLVIAADACDFPLTIYEKVGFAASGREGVLWRSRR